MGKLRMERGEKGGSNANLQGHEVGSLEND